MEELVKALTIGVTNGLIIALIAIGYTLVYGILELINFAHADVFMLGTAFTYFATELIVRGFGIPASSTLALVVTLMALPIIMLMTATINASIERLAYRPLAQRPETRAADQRDRDVVRAAEHRAVAARTISEGRRAGPAPDRPGVLPERRGLVRRRRDRSCSASRSRCCWPCAGSSRTPARARRCGPRLRTARRRA